MAAQVLLNQHQLGLAIGTTRLQRLVRAGWLAPAQRSPTRVLYRVSDVRACLRRLEAGEVLPPDQIESARTNGSAIRHGRGYVPKEKKVRQPLDAIELDFSAVKL